jgi:DNA-binding NarL/FixJ family response regulator
MSAACDTDHGLAILAVDDDPAVLSALQRLLHSEGLSVMTAQSGGEALALLAEHSPSIGAVVTDYAMPGLNGVDLLRAVRHQWPHIARVLLTGQADVKVAARAVNEGQLVHFFTKPWQAAEVRAALVEVIQQHRSRLLEQQQAEAGQKHTGSLRDLLLEIATAAGVAVAPATTSPAPAVEPLLAPLTAREREVLKLITEGQTNRQIAARLQVSPATARNHVEHILRKLDVADRTQAAVKALELGLVAR